MIIVLIAALAAAAIVVKHSGGTTATGNSPTAGRTRHLAAAHRVGSSLVATTTVPELTVYTRPGGLVYETLSEHDDAGSIVTMLVAGGRPGWLEVYLPGRPNGALGWVHRSSVTVSADPYFVIVDLTTRRILVTNHGRVVVSQPVGVGQAVSPTPDGLYYVTDAVKEDPLGPYGPYALGLSAHSDVYTSFDGGNGQVALHGTNDPIGIGRYVSHGCIRMSNQAITYLARHLPLGTPVLIHRD